MVEYYEGRLCIPAKELVERGLVSEANYKKMAIRKKFDVARTAERFTAVLSVPLRVQ